MKKFKGTAICQFNVDVIVEAKNLSNAKDKINKYIDKYFNEAFQPCDIFSSELDISFDECFEVLDISEA